MPTPPAFAQAFPVYLTNARTARTENRHHDYRRGLFLDLLRQAFGIRADEVDVEQFVRIDMRRRGWIDALFRNLVFEFKRDLERECGDGQRELVDFLATLPIPNTPGLPASAARRTRSSLKSGLGAGSFRRGGFPLSFLAGTEEDSLVWRKNFIQTFLERDLPQMGVTIPAASLYRFCSMLAHYHGQVWNAAEPARALGISESTVRRYLDVLQTVFMVRELQPWHENLGKRQVKSPKIYFHDTGILHQLLGIRSELDLLTHPKSGASWEGYVVEEVLTVIAPDVAYFWGTHNGAELDLLIFKDGRRLGVECKRVDAPRMTPGMRAALTDLQLEHLVVIYPGDRAYSLDGRVTVTPLAKIVRGSVDVLFPASS